MLYTRKDIEKIYSDLVVDYIKKGARIDFDNNNYSSSQFDNHVDLIADDGCRIIIYITTNETDRVAFRHYDRGLCEITVSVIKPAKNKYGTLYYPNSNAEKYVTYTFYRFKEIYTDNKEQFKAMEETEKKRRHIQMEYERNANKIKYNPSVILPIIRRRKGLKRIKKENIMYVEKNRGSFTIMIDTGKKRELITIGKLY